jgi:hypothetical protein
VSATGASSLAAQAASVNTAAIRAKRFIVSPGMWQGSPRRNCARPHGGQPMGTVGFRAGTRRIYGSDRLCQWFHADACG